MSKRPAGALTPLKRNHLQENGAAAATVGDDGAAKKLRVELPSSNPRPTTTASQQKAAFNGTKKEKEAKRLAILRQKQNFYDKYIIAFPSFVFYFEGDGLATQEALASIRRLGGKHERFFQKSVTHVVTSRKVPALPPKGDGISSIPASPGHNPFLDVSTYSIPGDLLIKAQEWNMKVWDLEKFKSVLDRLSAAPTLSLVPSATAQAKPAPPPKPSRELHSLLASESLHHTTHERDPTTLRPDYRYFSKGSFYVLVEDAKGEHRTILAKEYDRPRGGREGEWPAAFRNFLRPLAFEERVDWEKVQEQVAQQQQAGGSRAAALLRENNNPQVPNLRRAISLQSLNKKAGGSTHNNGLQQQQDITSATNNENKEPGYMAASGNSVNITSTAATSARSGAILGGAAINSGRMHLLENSMRRQVRLPVGTRRRSALSGIRGTEPLATASGAGAAVAENGVSGRTRSRASMLGAGDVKVAEVELEVEGDSEGGEEDIHQEEEQPVEDPAAAAVRLAIAQELEEEKMQQQEEEAARVQEQQRRAEYAKRELARTAKMGAPTMPKRHSLGGATDHHRVRLAKRVETAKPGYCENCRVKFDDFSQHVGSRRHRRFAEMSENYAALDVVLGRLVRQPLRPIHGHHYQQVHPSSSISRKLCLEEAMKEDECTLTDAEEDMDVDGPQPSTDYLKANQSPTTTDIPSNH